MINNHEKLTTLYTELATSIGSMGETEVKTLKLWALGLNDQNQLVPFSSLFRLDSKQRSLFKTLTIPFVDARALGTAPKLFEQLVPEFRGANLVDHLAYLTFDTPPLKAIPAPLGGNQGTLEKLLAFIHADLANVDASRLATLPIVRSRQDYWYTAKQQIYRHTNAKECELFKTIALAFVHGDWVGVAPYRDLYERAGVPQLDAFAVIDALERDLTARKDEETLIATETLLGIFRYLQQRDLTDHERERLRNLRLCRTQGKRWVTAASNKAHLPTGRQLPPNILSYLGKLDDSLIHEELLNDVGLQFLHHVLRVPLLDEAAIITNLILLKYSNKTLDDEAKRVLLGYVLRTLPGLTNDKQDLILTMMKDMPILQAQDGRYYLPRQIYFPSGKLDTLFVAGYLALNPNYDIPPATPGQASIHQQHPWYPWLIRLGVAETARIGDVVAAIHPIVQSGPPSEALVNELRPLYIELNNNVTSHLGQDNGIISLRELAWLPAVDDARRWHKPVAIYPPRLTNHIGDQAPILRFIEPTPVLRDILGMASEPPVEIVIKHLLASSAKQEEIQPGAVYDFLGRFATDAQIRDLKQQAVVWEPRQRRYWLARHVFFTNQSRLFGKRRGYLERPSDNVLKFLQKLGVHDEPSLQDSLDLIKEIATDQSGNPVAPLDLQLLNAQFTKFGRYLREEQGEIERVRLPDGLAFVPGGDGCLHLPTRLVQVDLSKALDYFDPAKLPQLTSDVGEEARYYLSRVGVPRLSHVMRREIVEARNPTSAIREEERLRQRARAFDRVAFKHLWQDHEPPPLEERPSAKLCNIQVKYCTKLEIRYHIYGSDGWHIPGEQRAVTALYEDQHVSPTLYLAQGIRTDTELVALALELDQVLFAGQAGSSIIEQILTWQPAELETQLDMRNFPTLPVDHFHQPIVGASDEEIMGRYDETTPIVEMESREIANNHNGIYLNLVEIGPLFNSPTYDMSKNGANNGDQAANQTATQNEFKWADDPAEIPQKWSDSDANLKNQDQLAEDDEYTDLDDEESGIAPLPIDDHFMASNPTNSWDRGGRLRSPSQSDAPHTNPSQWPDAESTSITYDIERIPPFTGQLRPTVPYRPNDYAALHKRHGFPDLQMSDSDAHFEEVMNGSSKLLPVADDEPDAESSPDNSTPHTVRIVLSFQNRTEGFFTLNEPILAMLEGSPSQITCNTDLENWTFPLYIDRHQGVLYNQKSLPRFFEAFNIPAGGIVYLKRQTYDSVRLYWKQADSRVETITCYELTEEGELEQFIIESAEYECEVSDTIVRAEKRLEDRAALFTQAQGKSGLFTILCDIPAAAKGALSYSEIVRAVHATRPFSDYAIRFELYTRPCFVEDKNGCWHFDAQHGYLQDKTQAQPRRQSDAEKRQNRLKTTMPNAPTATSPTASTPAALVSAPPFTTQFQYVSDAISGWHARLADPFSSSALDQLKAFLQELHTLYTRLEHDMIQLQAPLSALDETLVELWKEIESSPAIQNQAERLVDYLVAGASEQEDLLMATVDNCLVQTSPELRSNIFLPALVRTAERVRRNERILLARALYEQVQQQDGGDFSTQLNELDRLKNLDTYLAEIAEATNRSEKWQWAELAWNDYPNNSRLHNTLLTEIIKELAALPSTINRQEDAAARTEALIAWLQPVWPLREIIKGQDKLSLELCAQAQTLWRKLYVLWEASPKEGVYPPQMLRLAAVVNGATDMFYTVVPADQLLQVLYLYASMENKADNKLAATGLAEYGRLLMEQKSSELTNQARYIKLYTLLTDLYEKQGLFHLAYARFGVARQLTSDSDEKRRLNPRHDELRNHRYRVSSEAHEVFIRQMKAQLADPAFAPLVDADIFCRMVIALETPQRNSHSTPT